MESTHRIEVPSVSTIEELIQLVWKALQENKHRYGPEPYAESPFRVEGVDYVLRITETRNTRS